MVVAGGWGGGGVRVFGTGVGGVGVVGASREQAGRFWEGEGYPSFSSHRCEVCGQYAVGSMQMECFSQGRCWL